MGKILLSVPQFSHCKMEDNISYFTWVSELIVKLHVKWFECGKCSINIIFIINSLNVSVFFPQNVKLSFLMLMSSCLRDKTV